MLEQRLRRLVEQLYEDSALTGDMDDADAQRLLAWGSALVQQIGQRSAGLNDDEAEEFLYPHLKNLRRVMRRINDLLGSLPHLGEGEAPSKIEAALLKIFAPAGEIPGLVVDPTADPGALAHELAALAPPEALAAILSCLHMEEK